MGGHLHCEKSDRDEFSLRRVVMIENNWQEYIINYMKSSYQLWNIIYLETTLRKELEKLQELQICRRMASSWLKERFWEKDESSGGRI
jgi:hypothetical protein